MMTNIKTKIELNVLSIYKITLIAVCITLCQYSFAQNAPLIVDGSIVISDSESANPIAGAMRWTGQDLEVYDGTEWKSLTSDCNAEDSDVVLSCPASNFVQDNCTYTVNWTHDNPLSTTVNYDLRINGVDPGLSVTYPATSNTIDLCSTLGINSGSGTLDVELLYWYDGDTNAMISAGTCTVNYDLEGDNENAVLNCPASNFVQDDCTFTANWTHNNPSSTTVNYDLRINGVDPGLSVTYPATSNTIDMCNALGINSGSGTLDVELLYWYDEDTNAQISAGTCTVNYDIDPPTHGQGKTFAQIEAATDLPNFCNDSDDAYVAEYLYQNPDVCYWEVRTVNGVKSVVPLPVPGPPNNAIQLPAPSGNDDTAALESVINGNGTNKVFVGSGSYKVNQLDIDKAGTVIHNMKVTPAPGAGELIHINADDVRLIDCPQDMQNQGSAYLGVSATFADRFHLIRSGLKNMLHDQGKSGGGVKVRGCADFHIAGGDYIQILNKEKGENISRANIVWVTGWYNGGRSLSTDGGYIVNLDVEDVQSQGPELGNSHWDGEFLTIQAHVGHAKPIKAFANRCLDVGKRFVKVQQDGGVTVLSNYYEWLTEESIIGKRKRYSMIDIYNNVGDVIARNNRLVNNGVGQWGYVMTIAPFDRTGSDIHLDCNLIEINNPWTGATYNQRVFGAWSKRVGEVGTDTSAENINCTINNNTVFGTGGVNYHYYFGRGFDLNSGPLQPTGNTFNLSDPSSPHQGIERQ